MRKEVPFELATRLVNHGPVVLVSSLYDEKVDITPVAWNMPISKKPPTIALEIGGSHFIFECIKKTGDFVINVPSKNFVEDVVTCGSCSGRDNDKFSMCRFTQEPSQIVKSPRVKEAIAVLECVLLEDKHLMDEYNIVTGEVKYAEAEENAFGEHWSFENEEFKTIHHLGNKTFCVPEGKILDLRK